VLGQQGPPQREQRQAWPHLLEPEPHLQQALEPEPEPLEHQKRLE
jgi:hypothetical protein